MFTNHPHVVDLIKSLNGVDFTNMTVSTVIEQSLLFDNVGEVRIYFSNGDVYASLLYKGDYLSQWRKLTDKEAK